MFLQGCCPAPSPEDARPPESAQRAPEGPSLVRGTVTLKGQAPKQKLINLANALDVQRQAPVGLRSERVVVDLNNHVQWAFVYVKTGLENRRYVPPSYPVSLQIDGYRFSPHAFGIMVGQPLEICNVDSNLHTFHTVTNLNLNMVSLPLRRPVGETRFSFSEAMASIRCDVHPWEQAWVGVLPHPFCAVTGPDGSYEIRGLPPGKYVLEAWHEYYTPVSVNIEIATGGVAAVDFVLQDKRINPSLDLSPKEKLGSDDPRMQDAQKLLAEADRLWDIDSAASIRAYQRLLKDYHDIVIQLQVRTRVEGRARQADDN